MAPEPKTSCREVPVRKRVIILDPYRQGKSILEIKDATKLLRSTIRSIIDRYKDEKDPTLENKPRSGRPPPPRELSERAERKLLRHASDNPKDTLFALRTPSTCGKLIGRNLVRKTLKKYGKAKRKPRKKPWLCPDNIGKRLEFAQSEEKIKRDYNTVCWSDEVTFYVGEDKNLCYVTRGPGEEWNNKNLQPTFKSGRQAVGVWSCFCGDEIGPLVIIPKGVL
jgi:transposase